MAGEKKTKKATIGEDSKVKHLSYIGDASVGKQSNIGAGTITCNYDGTKKSHTFIGNNAFIGSHTSLVAPIKLGNQVTIGAGSTITHSVDDNQLAVSRSPQKVVKNWKVIPKNFK